MTPHDLALLLLEKALEDEAAATVLAQTPAISDEIIGFHYQQAAEKLLKSVLAERGVQFPYSHDLLYLGQFVERTGLVLPSNLKTIDALTPYAVVLRYDRAKTTQPLDRQAADDLVRELRVWAELHVLGT